MTLPPFPSGFTEAVTALNRGEVESARHILEPMAYQHPHDVSVVAGALLALTYSVPAPQWPASMNRLAVNATHPFAQWLTHIRRQAGAWLQGNGSLFQSLHVLNQGLIDTFNNSSLEYRTAEEAANLAGIMRNASGYYSMFKEMTKLTPPPSRNSSLPTIAMVGDSHSLPPHHQTVLFNNQLHQIESHLCLGAKLWNLARPDHTMYRHQLQTIFNIIPTGTPILLSLGEIDTRPNEGILNYAKQKGKQPEEAAQPTFTKGIHWLKTTYPHHTFIVSGIPAPRLEWTTKHYSTPQTQSTYAHYIQACNNILRQNAHIHGYAFLNLHQLTAHPETLFSNEQWHLDRTHLIPTATPQAFLSHLEFPQ